jgi:NADH-quinone oxidoreductase subunit M
MISDLHFSWLEGAILCPLLGAAFVATMRDSHVARKWCLLFSGLTLLCTIGAGLDFQISQAAEADDPWHLVSRIFGRELLLIDQVSAPLLPLVALLYFLTQIATVRTKVERFPFASSLLSEAILLATYSCKIPWGIAGLMALGTILPGLELRSRRRPAQIYWTYMALFVGMLCAGLYYLERAEPNSTEANWAALVLGIALLIRSGVAPFHSWIPDLFDRATFGTALLFVTPMVGAYGVVRLLVPIAPDWLLHTLAVFAIISALYGAALALIQREARRFFSYLFLSTAALVITGLSNMSHHGLTGGLCVWLSLAISLGGLGLTLRAMESRRGRLSMEKLQGLYDHTPNLAMCYGLTALAAVGFPGTFGFVGSELLVDATVETHPYVGIIVVLATTINGIAVVQTFFRLFGGAPYLTSVSFQIRTRERYAVLLLAAVVFIGGLFPQPIVASRSRAAEEILRLRLPVDPPKEADDAVAIGK